jgi:ABC-type multidrug transport system permease subunit
MNMLRVLLAKDLRRAWRNPLPWLINLALPLCITVIVGLAFGGKSESRGLGRIRFAVVDEDQSVLSDFLRGAANQREGGKYLEPVFLQRDAALRQITEGKLSAAVIIPTNFTRNYLTGDAPVRLELVKNPAESIHPAVLEELLGAVVTALNAVARNFQSEFPEWRQVIEGNRNQHEVAALVERAGDKLQAVKRYINPPLVGYEKEAHAEETKGGDAKGGGSSQSPAFNLFAFLLVGMCGMFLLFLANTGMLDLHQELLCRTFERYHTLRHPLAPFVAGKVIVTVVLLLISSVILLVGGGLIFRIPWRQPVVLAVVTVAYCCFAASFMAALVALAPDPRRASTVNSIAAMLLGLAGGCAFPADNLPALLRHTITPYLPSYWYTTTLRLLQFGSPAPWGRVTLQLLGVSLLLIALAAFLFRRRFKNGLIA